MVIAAWVLLSWTKLAASLLLCCLSAMLVRQNANFRMQQAPARKQDSCALGRMTHHDPVWEACCVHREADLANL